MTSMNQKLDTRIEKKFYLDIYQDADVKRDHDIINYVQFVSQFLESKYFKMG